jgi:hypothetical protein
MDYDLETQTILDSLRKAKAMQGAEMPPNMTVQRFGNLSQPIFADTGSLMAPAISQIFGNVIEKQARAKQADLSQRQQSEMDSLQRELATPGAKKERVLQRTLSDVGPTQPEEVEQSVPLSPIEENQRRMGIAQKMSRLPMAREMAGELWKKGVAFPEKMMELQARQEETGAQNAMRLQEAARMQEQRLEDQRQRAREANDLKLLMAQMAQANRGSNADLQRELLQTRIDTQKEKRGAASQAAQEKKQATNDAYENSLNRLEQIVTDVKTTPNLSAALGAVEGRLPALASFSPQQKSTAQSRIKNLQEYLQTKGLEDLRRGGVAPGSVTEKEWSKFAARAANIDPTLDETSFNRELNNLLKDVNAARQKLPGRSAPASAPAMSPSDAELLKKYGG